MGMHRALQAGHKAGAHLYAFGPQGKGSSHAPPIDDAACSNQGHIHFFAYRLQEDQGADLLRVFKAAALAAFNHQAIDASFHAFERHLHRGYGVINHDTCRLERRDELGRAARRGGNETDTNLAHKAQHGLVFEKTYG